MNFECTCIYNGIALYSRDLARNITLHKSWLNIHQKQLISHSVSREFTLIYFYIAYRFQNEANQALKLLCFARGVPFCCPQQHGS